MEITEAAERANSDLREQLKHIKNGKETEYKKVIDEFVGFFFPLLVEL